MYSILNIKVPHQYTTENKNNQTTSTKCQYQAAASNPKWWDLEKWAFNDRTQITNKNKVPTITWNPWNPVAIKKAEPKIESLIIKEDI